MVEATVQIAAVGVAVEADVAETAGAFAVAVFVAGAAFDIFVSVEPIYDTFVEKVVLLTLSDPLQWVYDRNLVEVGVVEGRCQKLVNVSAFADSLCSLPFSLVSTLRNLPIHIPPVLFHGDLSAADPIPPSIFPSFRNPLSLVLSFEPDILPIPDYPHTPSIHFHGFLSNVDPMSLSISPTTQVHRFLPPLPVSFEPDILPIANSPRIPSTLLRDVLCISRLPAHSTSSSSFHLLFPTPFVPSDISLVLPSTTPSLSSPSSPKSSAETRTLLSVVAHRLDDNPILLCLCFFPCLSTRSIPERK